jgi:hypothetical protein
MLTKTMRLSPKVEGRLDSLIRSRSRKRVWIVVVALICLTLTGQIQAQTSNQQPRDIKITLSVEKEGPNGQFAQAGTDLTNAELATLRSSIEDRLLKANHLLVPEDYATDHLYLSVVTEKIKTAGGPTYFVVSSALSVGKTQGNIGSLTHDVIAESTLDATARAVVYYLLAIELRGVTGNLNN